MKTHWIPGCLGLVVSLLVMADPAEGTDGVNLGLLPTNESSSPAATSVNELPKNFGEDRATIPETTAATLGLLAVAMMVLRRKRN
ncbi:MAG: hypothetical protein ABI162_12635 [Luteolibacter sp.]